jgi:hypothetical protein
MQFHAPTHVLVVYALLTHLAVPCAHVATAATKACKQPLLSRAVYYYNTTHMHMHQLS